MELQSYLSLGEITLLFIQTVIIIAATIFALVELRMSRKSRQVETIDKAFAYASSIEVRNARRRVREIKNIADVQNLSPSEIDDIEQTLIGWSRIGVLLELGAFGHEERSILLRSYSWSIDNCWEMLKPYIQYQRQKTEMPDLWANFEVLATLAHNWRTENKLPTWHSHINKDKQG